MDCIPSGPMLTYNSRIHIVTSDMRIDSPSADCIPNSIFEVSHGKAVVDLWCERGNLQVSC